MIFKGHFIALAALLFTEYKDNKAKLYFMNDTCFDIDCSLRDYKIFLDALYDVFGQPSTNSDQSPQEHN